MPAIVSTEVRWRMIADAAYYRFQSRGCVHGYHEQDWQDAESEIDRRLNGQDGTAGYTAQVNGRDNLEIIEGVGPKIAELLVAAGVTTFAKLADSSPATLQGILDRAGPRYALAVPGTWPQQAALAARGEWFVLRRLQDELTGGVSR